MRRALRSTRAKLARARRPTQLEQAIERHAGIHGKKQHLGHGEPVLGAPRGQVEAQDERQPPEERHEAGDEPLGRARVSCSSNVRPHAEHRCCREGVRVEAIPSEREVAQDLEPPEPADGVVRVVLARRSEQEVNARAEPARVRDRAAHEKEKHARDRERERELAHDLAAPCLHLAVEQEPERHHHREAGKEDGVGLILRADRERGEEEHAPEPLRLAPDDRARRLEEREARPEHVRHVEVARVRVVRERRVDGDHERNEQRRALAPHLLRELCEEVDDPERHELAHAARDDRERGHGRDLDHRSHDVGLRERRRAREREAPHRRREHRQPEEVHRRIREVVARQYVSYAPTRKSRGAMPSSSHASAPGSPHVEPDDVHDERSADDPGERRRSKLTKEREEPRLHDCSAASSS